jgi:phage terminase large subunit-like protein
LSGWDLSCPDWQERLQAGRSLVPTLPLDEFGAARAVAVFNKLRLADVPGTPTMEEAGGEWFREIVRALFGSLDPLTRHRAIRELMVLVPKKNSKTTNGALLMLTALLLNDRPQATFIMTAPVQDVAELAFSAAMGAIELDPVLKSKLHTREHLKMIVHRETKAELQIMTFDPSVVTGQKVSGGALIDELHVIAKMGKAASAIRQLRGGMLPFPEAFLAFITTQSEEPPSGVFDAELTKARAIRDGKRQGSMLPVLYELPEAMQKDPLAWRDPVNWPMVTPNAGRSITIPRLIEEMKTAQETSNEELIAWASQHLNLQIGLSLHDSRWAGADFWEDAALAPALTLEELLARCEVVVVGIDGGGLDDLLGLAVIGRERETRKWLLWLHAWAHPIVLERRTDIAARLLDFRKDGDLTLVEKVGQDVKEVADICATIRASGLLPEENAIGVDAVGIGDIVDELYSPARKFTPQQIVAVSQGWKLNAAIKTTERKVAGGELIHGGSRLGAWSVSNARVNMVGNAITITKQKSGSAKIDPLMATFDAVTLMAMNPAARKAGLSFFFM